MKAYITPEQFAPHLYWLMTDTRYDRSKCLCMLCQQWWEEYEPPKRKRGRYNFKDYPSELMLCCSGSRTPPPPSRTEPLFGLPRRYAVGDTVWIQVRLDPKIRIKHIVKLLDDDDKPFEYDTSKIVGPTVTVPWPAEIIEEVPLRGLSGPQEISHILTTVPPMILTDTSSTLCDYYPSTIHLRAHQIHHQTRTPQGFPTHFYNIQPFCLKIEPPYTLTLPQHHLTPYTQNPLLENIETTFKSCFQLFMLRKRTHPDPLTQHFICATIKTIEQIADTTNEIFFPVHENQDETQQQESEPYLSVKGEIIHRDNVVLVKKSESTPTYLFVVTHLVKGGKVWGWEVAKRQDRKGNLEVDEDGIWYHRIGGRPVEVNAEWVQGRAWPFREEGVVDERKQEEQAESINLIDEEEGSQGHCIEID